MGMRSGRSSAQDFGPKTLRILLLCGLPCVAAPAEAIVIRHDVADTQYVVPDAAYPEVVDLISRGDCAGTLVHPSFLLTVAHCAADLSVGATLTVAGAGHTVAEIFLHPSWRDQDAYDIALVRFATPVTGVAPVPVYRGADERGQTITIVGRGDTATGLVGEGNARNDGQLRRATNVVTAVNAHFLEVAFERGTESGVTALEGVGAAGDSGGPSFLEVGGVRYLAGLNAYGEEADANEVAAYGSRDYQTRVSRYLDWLDGILPAAPAPTQKLTVVLSPASALESAGTLTGGGRVQLDAPAATNVTVTLAADPIGHLTLSPVTIAAGASSASFDVTPIDDPPGAADTDRTVRITATAAGYDAGSASFTVRDDEVSTGALTVRWSQSTVVASEGALLVDVRARLSAPTTRTIPFTIQGTATWNEDFRIAGERAELVFADSTEAVVSIVLIDDDVIEDDETILLSLSGEVEGSPVFVLTVEDDDTMLAPREPPVAELPEGGCTCVATPVTGASWIVVLGVLAALRRRR